MNSLALCCSFSGSGVLNEPINHCIDVYWVLTRDHVTTNLSVCYGIKPPASKQTRVILKFRPVSKELFPVKTYSWSTKAGLERASDLSILLPRIKRGMPFKDGFVKRSCNSLLDMGTLSRSAASITYLQILPTQYIKICLPNSKLQRYRRRT